MTDFMGYFLGKDVAMMCELLDKTFPEDSPEYQIVVKGSEQLITRSMMAGGFCFCLGIAVIITGFFIVPLIIGVLS